MSKDQRLKKMVWPSEHLSRRLQEHQNTMKTVEQHEQQGYDIKSTNQLVPVRIWGMVIFMP